MAPAFVGAGGLRWSGATGAADVAADLTPNYVAHDANGQATLPLIEVEVFIVHQNYRRIGGLVDQRPDTGALLDYKPAVPTRKHESRFDDCLF